MHEFDESAHFAVFIVSRRLLDTAPGEMPGGENDTARSRLGRDARQSVTVGQTCQFASLTKSWFMESERVLTQAGRPNANQCHGPSGVGRRPAVGQRNDGRLTMYAATARSLAVANEHPRSH